MKINLESSNKNTIKSYDESHITVNNTVYNDSLIISRHTIISPWSIHSVQDLTEEHFKPIIELQPEVILIGHHQTNTQIPMKWVQYLANQHIGIECMSIGAASRTFNVLLSEQRAVVVGLLFWGLDKATCKNTHVA